MFILRNNLLKKFIIETICDLCGGKFASNSCMMYIRGLNFNFNFKLKFS